MLHLSTFTTPVTHIVYCIHASKIPKVSKCVFFSSIFHSMRMVFNQFIWTAHDVMYPLFMNGFMTGYRVRMVFIIKSYCSMATVKRQRRKKQPTFPNFALNRLFIVYWLIVSRWVCVCVCVDMRINWHKWISN